MLDTWLPFLGAVAFFTALHLGVIRLVEPVYPRAFQISRGLSAAILTVIGVSSVAFAWDRWDEAFLYRHETGDWMRLALLAVYGHLVSDLLWMVVGKVGHDIHPRKDLVLHHLLGIVGFGLALWLRVGYAIALLTMVTELLPVSTGVNAWGKRLGSQRIVDGADRFRLHVLAWLRLPLWIVLFLLVAFVFVEGRATELLVAYTAAGLGLLLLIALDLFWIQKCRQKVDFY